ncbi:phosphonopyruvate decarboxylase [Kordiimonas aquimaris]|uniref:phosphonopyruvate decarboxylase n=1 Tax=Kordiimonas aquimaris TaxID=707591 RepID=UPI0021CE5FED|nr:phosphonopyruvate decarboxylase [Kordiimonas aquimaris]
MLDGHAFNQALSNAGIDFYSGVPCSLLGAAMQDAAQQQTYVGAASEGEALAIAAGAWLAGCTPAVFLQNSGLGNLVNPLTSLNNPFGIPCLLVIGWRGMPGKLDEPQHEVMGAITSALLDLMGIAHHVLPENLPEATSVIQTSVQQMHETRMPVALLVRSGTFKNAVDSHDIKVRSFNELSSCNQIPQTGKLPTRFEVLQTFVDNTPDNAAVVATTGKCGRELYTIKDSSQHLYMVGAMGSASAVGLGIALKKESPVIVLDGDGAALMRLGTFATIGREAPSNLVHIMLDNAAHDSTGGQPTGSEHMNFCSIAAACGYLTYTRPIAINDFKTALSVSLSTKGPHFIHVPIETGSKADLARPNILPRDVATRLASFLKNIP